MSAAVFYGSFTPRCGGARRRIRCERTFNKRTDGAECGGPGVDCRLATCQRRCERIYHCKVLALRMQTASPAYYLSPYRYEFFHWRAVPFVGLQTLYTRSSHFARKKPRRLTADHRSEEMCRIISN